MIVNKSIINLLIYKNSLFLYFYVSHLSFYKQNETGINLDELINNYHNLYYIIENKECLQLLNK
jgi:hypothetical protein